MVKTFLLSLAPTCNGVYRTCLLTPSATDTFRTVGVFHRVDHHLASLCTFSTVNAFFHIYTVAVNGDLIEYGIKCAKRTNITAKWSVNNNGKNNCHDQNCIFPYVQPANGTTHRLVQKYQRQSALQSSGRTDQLTEIGCSLAHYICEKQGKQNYKHQKNHVFQLSKKFVSFESTNFLWKRNLIQQILDQSKRTEKSAHQSSQDRSYENQESDYVVGKFKVPASNHGL